MFLRVWTSGGFNSFKTPTAHTPSINLDGSESIVGKFPDFSLLCQPGANFDWSGIERLVESHPPSFLLLNRVRCPQHGQRKDCAWHCRVEIVAGIVLALPDTILVMEYEGVEMQC